MFFRETRGLGSFILIAAPLLISASVTESAATLQFQQENNTNLLAEDACGSSPCWRGTCFGNGTDYQCFCPSGFTGKNCETTLDVCSTNPCVRGACLHHHEAYYCVCPSGYTGKNCESIINACNSDPCVRGVCYHHQTQFHCECPTGYYGKRCEIENNECFSRPCLNGGLCVDAVGNYSCNCVPGFTGDNCQTELDECSSNPCLHGDVCKDGINRFTCQCPTGYTGDRCQNVTDPCKYNPCIRGTCFARLSQFICECPPGYTGKLCDNTIQLALYGPNEVFIKLPAGNQLNLNCSVSTSGYYTTFKWSKTRGCDGLYGSDRRPSVYHKSSTTIGDAGTYVCKASYRSEPSVLKVFHVNITWHSETCDFDSGSLCGWSSPGSSWNQQYGKHNDHTLGTTKGRYMAIDTTSQTDKTALLTSHNLPANHTVCFEFWYRISGSGYGKLSTMLKDTCLKKETELFQSIGDQGVKWNKVTVTVLHSLIPNDYNIILKADIRRSFIGTMAVDDLKISDGHCQGNEGLSLVG